MCKILMSINPEHVNNILNGNKIYEYRKTKCKKKIDSIVIYSTAPVMKVIAEVEVKCIIEGEPNAVWQKTKNGAGIEKSFYDEYYKNRSKAVAYCLGNIQLFEVQRSLPYYGIKTPPQSFIYLN